MNAPTDPITVVLVDDHKILRQGIRSLLADEPGIVVVGEASDGEGALDCVEATCPDVVVMDMVMPGMNGLEATKRIVAEYPATRVLILSMYDDDEYVQEVIQAGAAGYLLKGVGANELIRGIQEVHHGSSFLNPAIAAKLIEDYVRLVHGPAVAPAPDVLTAREREVLKLIAEGNSNRRIAEILGLSCKTVNSHRTNLMRKLDMHDVTGLVRYALREGFIDLP